MTHTPVTYLIKSRSIIQMLHLDLCARGVVGVWLEVPMLERHQRPVADQTSLIRQLSCHQYHEISHWKLDWTKSLHCDVLEMFWRCVFSYFLRSWYDREYHHGISDPVFCLRINVLYSSISYNIKQLISWLDIDWPKFHLNTMKSL